MLTSNNHMQTPAFAIGTAVAFSRSIVFSNANGENKFIEGPAGYITIARARFTTEWEYCDNLDLDTWYPESAALVS